MAFFLAKNDSVIPPHTPVPRQNWLQRMATLPEGVRRLLAALIMGGAVVFLFAGWTKSIASFFPALSTIAEKQTNESSQLQEKLLSPAAGVIESFRQIGDLLSSFQTDETAATASTSSDELPPEEEPITGLFNTIGNDLSDQEAQDVYDPYASSSASFPAPATPLARPLSASSSPSHPPLEELPAF